MSSFRKAEKSRGLSQENGQDRKKKQKKAVISLTLRGLRCEFSFSWDGLYFKKRWAKKKRKRHTEKEKRIENLSYNDGVASGVLKGVRPALQTPFLVTRTWVCMCVSLKESWLWDREIFPNKTSFCGLNSLQATHAFFRTFDFSPLRAICVQTLIFSKVRWNCESIK